MTGEEKLKAFMDGFMEANKRTSRYKDGCMVEIMCRRPEFEKRLDDMWKIYCSGNLKQVVEYKKQIADIKAAGLIVQRSKSTGKHRIVFP